MEEIFESAIRESGDMAGVFEHDGEVGYFYLYKISQGGANQIVGEVNVVNGPPPFSQEDIRVEWCHDQSCVGLFVRDKLLAVFDAASKRHYGGTYVVNSLPVIPPEVVSKFGMAG